MTDSGTSVSLPINRVRPTPPAIASSSSESQSSDDNLPLQKLLGHPRAANTNGTLTNGDGLALATATIKRESSSSDDSSDDIPLAQAVRPVGQRTPVKPLAPIASRTPKRKVQPAVSDSDSDSDVPLAKKVKATAISKAKPKATTTTTPKAKPKAATKATPKAALKAARTPAKSTSSRAKKGVKKEDEDTTSITTPMNDEEQEEEYKWWLEQKSDTSVKWKTLAHNGVVFPPPYVPHNIPLVYNGQKLILEPPAEEIASYFAQMLDTDYMKNPVFIKNFFREFQTILRECASRHTIEDFTKCDFTLMYEHFQRIKEQKKAMTKEEKDKLKKEREALKALYGVAYLDGRKEKVGNYTIEPPGLFRGRGEHPRTGYYKRRVQPEDVTVNIGKDAKVPEPPAGHRWKKVIHDSTVTWLAMWKDNVNDNFKYVFLAPGSSLKGQSDMKKFEMARNLKGCVDSIRKTYTADLKSKDMAIRQRATALYLIDKLALRAGNEKSDDEADTVGCCSLRCEHVSLEEPNVLVFDFLGKDSVRYFNSVPVDEQVFKNIKIFQRAPKGPDDDLFDRLNTTMLNKHLQSLMPGLTAKVFRTFNASITFQDELRKHTPKDGTLQERLSAYDKANRRVAELCNHQKGVGKSHESQMEKMQDKVWSLKYLRRRYIEQLRQVEPKMKRKRPELFEADPELTDDWILKYEIATTKKERERIVNKFDKENAERKQNKEKPLLKSDLKERLGEVIAKEKLVEKGKIPSVKEFPPMKRNATTEKLLEYIGKLDDRIKTAKLQMEDKDENKTMALTTSRLNYLDPRITIAWCKTFNVPVAKRFSATQREKFRWAMDVDPDWEF